MLKCQVKLIKRDFRAKTLQVIRDYLAFKKILYLCHRDTPSSPAYPLLRHPGALQSESTAQHI